ncbi:MAG: DUF6683 family protein [Pyrinomonadaceae bacterium]
MRFGFLIAILISSGLSVFGQSADGAWTLGPNWAYNRNISNLEIARIAMQGEINKRLVGGSSASKASKKRVKATGAGAYKIAPHVVPELVSTEFEGTDKQKSGLKSSLEDAIRFYENIAFQKRYPSNDLSFGIMYYVVNSYVIYRNIEPSAKDVSGQTQYLVGGFYSPLISHERALFQQIKNQLRVSKEYSALSDSEKQKATEMLAIYTTLMWHQFQALAAKRDMAGLGALRTVAASNVEGFAGSRIASIDIGEKGIVVVD